MKPECATCGGDQIEIVNDYEVCVRCNPHRVTPRQVWVNVHTGHTFIVSRVSGHYARCIAQRGSTRALRTFDRVDLIAINACVACWRGHCDGEHPNEEQAMPFSDREMRA